MKEKEITASYIRRSIRKRKRNIQSIVTFILLLITIPRVLQPRNHRETAKKKKKKKRNICVYYLILYRTKKATQTQAETPKVIFFHR